MKIVFVTNFINHHQVYLADEFYKYPNVTYHFIETEPMPESFKKSGYPDYSTRPYIVKAYKEENLNYSKTLIDTADIVIIGSAPEELLRKRLKQNKVTFHYSERWFKPGYKSLLSPRAWMYWFKNHILYRNKRSYMLCASAFTAKDCKKVFSYPGKCFKWGYFLKVENLDIEGIIQEQRKANRIKILFVARFLSWKHPELPVKLARLLKSNGINFELNMFGSGEELKNAECLIKELDVKDCVNLCGNTNNNEILELMRKHHIFLFTSDRNEGWGAVVNEAMSNGCSVVAGSEIGCVPFLIESYQNGMVFKDRDLRDLYDKVIYLIENPSARENIIRNAYQTMTETWSPQNAASNFIKLAKSAIENNITPCEFGPCSYTK